MNYLVLFFSFFKIGIFTFGGGYAMISIIQNEVVRSRKWIAEKEFLDLLTLAQSAPGPIALNTAVFVGYKMYGYKGALTALAGVVIPSFSILLIIAMFFAQIRHNPIVDAAFRGIQPIVVAIMLAPVLGFVKGLHWILSALAAALALGIWYFGISPIYFLIAGAFIGVVWAACRGKEVGR